MRPIYYIIISIGIIFMLANKKGYISNEEIVSIWDNTTESWEEISRTEESGWNLIYDENGKRVHVYETWTYKPGSLEPEYEVWINDTPLNKTLRDGMSDLGILIKYIWNA